MGVKLRERTGKGWYVLIDWKGQRKAKSFGPKKKLAEKFADKMTAQLKWAEQGGESVTLDHPAEKKMPTVREYLQLWRENNAKVHCKPSTLRGYSRSIDQQLIPMFGQYLLDKVGREEVRQFIATLTRQGKARGTVENSLVPLKAIYYQAIDDGLVQVNPAARLGKIFKHKKDRRASIRPLEREEVTTILALAQDRFLPLYPLLLCAVRTGMREGEVIGPQWGDIDFHGGFIEVRRGVVLRKETTTKTHKIRRVDMSLQLQRVLQELKELRQLEAMSDGREISPWVFLSPGGKRWDDRHLRRAWQRCLEVAGIRHVRFHDLRHTFASELAEQGAPPKYVQSQLGHSSIQVTMDVYSHLFEKSNREWVNRLDDPVEKEMSGVESATQTQPTLIESELRIHKPLKNMVAVEGFEPPARGL